jgi:hypothetical protein
MTTIAKRLERARQRITSELEDVASDARTIDVKDLVPNAKNDQDTDEALRDLANEISSLGSDISRRIEAMKVRFS